MHRQPAEPGSQQAVGRGGGLPACVCKHADEVIPGMHRCTAEAKDSIYAAVFFFFFYFNTSDIAAVIDGVNLCLMDTVCPGFASIMYSMKIIL